MQRSHISALLVALACGFFPSIAHTQDTQGLLRPFGVTMPLQSDLSTDMIFQSSVNEIDSTAQLEVHDGHFTNKSSQRVRLLGSLLSYGACFPDSAQAVHLAKRFHDLGMNSVRLRGWDYTAYLFQPGSRTTDTAFSATYLQRFDWFLYQLKKAGIYVYLSNMAFVPRAADGVTSYDSINYSWQVRVFQYVDGGYQRAQRAFLKRLFEHVNPYTGVAYKNEPALALMNCTDENSLLYYWNYDFKESGKYLIPGYQRRRLDTVFNSYLRTKYKDDVGLLTAWGFGIPDKTNRFTDPGFEDLFTSPWQTSINSGSAQAAYISSDADKVEGSRAALFKVLKGGTSSGDIQLLLRGLKVEKGKQYKFSIWMKSPEKGRKIYAYLLRGSTPYTGYGLSTSYTISDTWAEYTTSFSSNSSDDNTLLIIQLGGYNSDVYFDKASFTEDNVVVLRGGESLTTNTVSTLVANAAVSTRRIMETAEFMNYLQELYYTGMQTFFRDSLHSKIIIGSGMWTQNLNDVYTSRNLGFMSTSSYRGSYGIAPDNSKSSPWDNPWSLTRNLNAEELYGSVVTAFSRARVKSKPMVISGEFMAYPSPNVNELLSFLPMYATFQDADAYYFGDWVSTNAAPDLDSSWIGKSSIWEVKGQYALQSLIPSVSMMWKRHLIQPAIDRIRLNYNTAQRMMIKWQQSGNYLLESCDARMAFFRGVEIDSFDAVTQSVLPHLVIPEFNNPGGLDMTNVETDTKELLWNQKSGWFRVNTPSFVSATGQLNNNIFTFDKITAEKTDAAPMGTFTWVSADTNSIANAEKSLLSIAGKVQNYGAIFDGDSTLWRGWGRGGVQAEALSFRFSMKSDFDSLKLVALDSLGHPNGTVIIATRSSSGRFSFDVDQAQTHALWYQVQQRRIPNAIQPDLPSSDIQIFPNPAHTVLVVDLSSKLLGHASELRIVDLHGHVCFSQTVNPAEAIHLNTADLVSGAYMLQVSDGVNASYSRFSVIH